MNNRIGLALIMFLALLAQPKPAWTQANPKASSHGVVLMYHRFGEEKFPSTNIRLEQLDAHIRELKSGAYNVVPVSRILEAIRQGEELPPRTVGLTVDDGYLSIHSQAWPRLKTAGFPFTVFVSTDPIDKKTSGRLSWDQIREMAGAGVEIGAHTVSHLHMADASPEKVRRELKHSGERFQAELGRVPQLFAYPYGETSLAIRRLILEAGYKFAFGQHSGVVNPSSDFHYLPRFALNERWGEMGRFRQVINALPLPLRELTPADPLIGAVNPPTLGFTVDSSLKGLDRLNCFPSHGGKAKVERLGATRIEVRMDKALPPGRTRINCTLFVEKGRFRWFGTLFYLPKK